jgi:hypothetical protein
MDDVAFASWLGMVECLNLTQRTRALETLAKAPPGEPAERPDGEIKSVVSVRAAPFGPSWLADSDAAKTH